MSIAQEHHNKLDDLKYHEMKKKQIQDEILNLNSIKENGCDDILEMFEIDDKIYALENDLSYLKENTRDVYLLQVSSILKTYYNDNEYNDTEFTNETSDNTCSNLNNFVKKRVHNNRGQLYSQYMNVVHNTPMTVEKNKSKMSILCVECNVPMFMSTNESYTVCSICGDHNVYFEPSVSGLTYEQEINTETNMHFSYKRINHLRELLSQLQAKESSEIPEHVVQGVKAEFKKARVQTTSDISQEKVKAFLKKLGFNRYYEHTRQLTNLLSGTPPPTISNELYDKIINMFIDIQLPFEQCCPKNRKNFFSYNYILYKFCELLDQREHMKLFPLLKSREKLYQQDCIWKSICEIKGWSFIKSV